MSATKPSDINESLIDWLLALTPDERLREHDRALRLRSDLSETGEVLIPGHRCGVLTLDEFILPLAIVGCTNQDLVVEDPRFN